MKTFVFGYFKMVQYLKKKKRGGGEIEVEGKFYFLEVLLFILTQLVFYPNSIG